MKFNKKAQFSLDEINPTAGGLAFIGAIASLIVSSKVEMNILFRILTPIATFGACYFLVNRMSE